MSNSDSFIQVDFDATGEVGARDMVRNFFSNSRNKQRAKHEEFQRIYSMYKLVQDLTGKDKNRANIMIPKLFSTVETMVPHYMDALLGVRPYIPIELTQNNLSDIADAQTTLLDCYLHESDFFWVTAQWVKFALLFGTAFIECSPDYHKVIEKEFVPKIIQTFDGRQIEAGGRVETREVTRFKLNVKAYAPWEIYGDWNAQTIKTSRGIIKWRGMVSKREIKRMAENGMFPKYDADKLDSNMNEYKNDEWSKKMAQDIGVPLVGDDNDLGLWLSYEQNDRYIDIWNFNHILRDDTNPYNHNEINLTRIVNTDDPNPENSWFGIGDGKPIENLNYALNDNWNQAFDNHNQINHGVIYYKEDALNVDQLVMIGGNRIPVDPDIGESIADVIVERPSPGLSSDHYNIPGVLENYIDQTSGQHEISRGESAAGRQTARESMLLRQAGDSRIKLKIKMGEQMGLKDFGEKAVAIVDQFATSDDIVAKIGLEKASMLPSVNPANIEGGYNFAFKGSSRMADAQIKRQDSKDIYQLMAGNPSIRQDWLANWVLQKFEVPDGERRNAVIPDEMAAQIAAMNQAMIEQQNAETTRGSDSGAIGGSAGNSPTGRSQNEQLKV